MFRIVLCDDSPADLMVLCGHLEQLKEKRPVDILSYTDGLDLLKDYKQKGFCDILVLDMRMEPWAASRWQSTSASWTTRFPSSL